VFVNEAHQRVLALESLEAVLDFVLIAVEDAGDDRRIEIKPLHARRSEQASIRVVQSVDLPLDETANGFWKRPFERRKVLADDPLAILLSQYLTPAKIAEQIDDEERVSLGALMNQGRETPWKRVVDKLQGEIPPDGGLVERTGRNLAARASRDQIEL
jgi:hypothetical protein